MNTTIDIKLEEGGIMPKKEFYTAIGYDLYIPEDIIIETGRQVVKLNFRIKLPKGFGAYIFNRSGTSANGMKGYNIFDGDKERRYDCDVLLGLVDPTYEGVVGLLINNHDQAFKLKRGNSVAQMAIIQHPSVALVQTNEYVFGSERGEQGFNA